MHHCKAMGCNNAVLPGENFCAECTQTYLAVFLADTPITEIRESEKLSEKYPQYYKDVGDLTEIDVYATHHLFNLQDPSGCLHHASKKLLLSGVRTGSKSAYKDIKEARDTLTRWLQLNPAD